MSKKSIYLLLAVLALAATTLTCLPTPRRTPTQTPAPTRKITPMRTPTPPSPALQCIVNGDFSEGLTGWTKLSPSGRGTFTLKTVTDDPAHGMVLNWVRTGSGNDGGAIGVEQTFPSPKTVTYLALDVKVMSHDLTNPGWWCCKHPDGCWFEYPVHVYLYSGDEVVYEEGFLAMNDGSINPANCPPLTNLPTMVPLNAWYTFTMAEEIPNVTKIVLRGEGWDFNVRVDNIVVRCYP